MVETRSPSLNILFIDTYMFVKSYLSLVLDRPKWTIIGIVILTLCLGWYAQYFSLDASSDSLVVEGDEDLEFSRQMSARYGSGDFVFVTYTPQQELFSPPVLAELRRLKTELESLDRVVSIDSIFEVPLFKVANVSLNEVATNLVNLDTVGIDLEAAQQDLMSSDAYRNVLLSEDGKTAALVVNFEVNEALQKAQGQRSELRQLSRGTTDGNTGDDSQLKQIEEQYQMLSAQAAADLHRDIEQIREILDKYRPKASIAMGGVPMIADDLVTFVKNDLLNFGLAIIFFIIAALAYLFRKPRYVFIPLLCCSITAISIIGLLGLLNWSVTVISSNFLSLLLIITISLTVHLMVRYRELEQAGTGNGHRERLELTLSSMVKPCAYTSLTTIVAFGSLMVSEIPPIIDFGAMMVLGVFSAFVLTFLLFPAVLALLQASPSNQQRQSLDITPWLAQLTNNHGSKILLLAAALFIVSGVGMSRLKVENSFIDYFDDSTEIYQGMVFIDQNLGGTTPLDVIIDLARPNPFGDTEGGDEWGEDDFEEDEFSSAELDDENAYWFTSDKMQEIIEIHTFLEDLPETGKVLSLATLIKIAHELNDNQALNSIELGVLYNSIPADYKETLLKPYVSIENNQVRFSLRVLETDPQLVRSELLVHIQEGLVEEFGFVPEQVQLTGMLVLYNNMLQGLFDSQILTLALVLIVILFMFIVLFRSYKLALIGIVPNILAAAIVLGLMGWLDIPLDMMTITIAAVSVGIGVDNTIHYIHRFKSSFPEIKDYRNTMLYCHSSIGQAMYYTSFTIVVGFSLLVLSNFIPTIYFGLLTSLAMIIALTGALTLLPQLLIVFRPLD
ncbi:MMPL family transporter [Gammaproteobacteria bacterium]|nr:MMPL family transporter [Gammaproteobacteria bacterium]